MEHTPITPAKPRKVPALTELSINGVTEFYSPADSISERFAEIHALLLVLAAGHECAEEATAVAADPLTNLRHGIKASALHGIATLAALGMHHFDVDIAASAKGGEA